MYIDIAYTAWLYNNILKYTAKQLAVHKLETALDIRVNKSFPRLYTLSFQLVSYQMMHVMHKFSYQLVNLTFPNLSTVCTLLGNPLFILDTWSEFHGNYNDN